MDAVDHSVQADNLKGFTFDDYDPYTRIVDRRIGVGPPSTGQDKVNVITADDVFTTWDVSYEDEDDDYANAIIDVDAIAEGMTADDRKTEASEDVMSYSSHAGKTNMVFDT